MPLNWLSVVAKSIPWGALFARAPEIIDASANLLEKSRSRGTTPASEIDAESLAARLFEQERIAEENAELIADMSAQLEGLTEGLRILAARNRMLIALTTVLALVCAVETAVLVYWIQTG